MSRIMGATGTGKSTFVNVASGSQLPVGRGLQSCTSDVMTSKPFLLNGHTVTLIDTPGFDDTNRSDTDILRSIAAYLANTYEQGARLAGIIYMHRISDFRMGGTSSRNFRIFRELCGESTLRNVLIVTNMWSEVDPSLGEERERELATNSKFFKPVVDRGARMLRNLNTRESAHAILRHLINAQAHTLQIQHEIVNEHRDLSQTSAGAELTRLLKEQSNRHEEQLKEVRRELEQAMRAKDEEARKELQEEISRKQDEIDQMRSETERMAADFTRERARLEARIAEMEKAHVEHLRKLEEQAQREKELIAARDEAQKRANGLEKKLESVAAQQSRQVSNVPTKICRHLFPRRLDQQNGAKGETGGS
ncbi:P-loop containing nucleoside triphosphate hydrolase protein [Scleroderma citrinum]